MKIYEALAKAFRREQVDTCFALLGDANMHWAGALADNGTRFIYTRHEHAAVAGAAAFARATGKTGVASVTCGPGLTQIMTILPIAVRARIPLVIFAGEAPSNKPWYNQGIDQRPFVEACGAQYHALHEPSKMIADVHHAFANATMAQTPVIMGVPFDLQQQVWVDEREHPVSNELFVVPKPCRPCSDTIEQAATWLLSAERPIVLAGLGTVSDDARLACIELAEHAGACLATTLPAKGLFYDQAYCLGVAGGYASDAAKALFSQTDLVIAIGARLAAHTFDGGSLTPQARVIHMDTHPQAHVQGRHAADLLITCDAQLGAKALTKTIVERRLQQNAIANTSKPTYNRDNTPATESVRAPTTKSVRDDQTPTSTTATVGDGWRTPHMLEHTAAALCLPDASQCETPDGLLHPMAVIKTLSEIIPPTCHIVNTSGHCAYYTAQMNHHPQSHYTVVRDFGAIGNGTSFALGIAAGLPERPVILLDGDGSVLMNIQELETLHRHGLNVLTIVFNDGAYGSEVHKLRADGVTLAGSVFGRADFAAIARGFGLQVKTFTSLDGLDQGMHEYVSNPIPALWDIHISDQVASPQILKAHKASHSQQSWHRTRV